MLLGQKKSEYRRKRKSRAEVLPAHITRCGGKGCAMRDGCIRFTQLKREVNVRNTWKGDSYVVTFIGERINFCEKKMESWT